MTAPQFFIKYLRTLGFDATNDIFAEKAWYFRNALVRANYNDLKNGVHETTEYLELFLRNLLLDEKNRDHELKGKYDRFRECHIQPDWLLIYLLEDNVLTLTLVDMGTHSGLFDM